MKTSNRELTTEARTLVRERVQRVGKFLDTRHPIPQFQTLLGTHNQIHDALVALTDYTASLELRILELEANS